MSASAMRMFFILILLPCALVQFDIFAQKEVFLYKNNGVDTLSLLNNNSFESFGALGLAKTIVSSGEINSSGDTLFLIQKVPTFINKLDTNHKHKNKVDTLIRLDKLTIVTLDYDIYKLIEKYDETSFKEVYNWTYVDTTLNGLKIRGEIQNSLLYSKFPVKHGPEIHYLKNGKIERTYWKHGKLLKD